MQKEREKVAIRLPIEEHDESYSLKDSAIEAMIGIGNGWVSHSVMPYELHETFSETPGFSLPAFVDLYYHQPTFPGTGFFTKELHTSSSGQIPSDSGNFELIMFSKNSYDTLDQPFVTPFNSDEDRFRRIMTRVGLYSKEHKLDPAMVIELEEHQQTNLLLTSFKGISISKTRFNLFLVMEITKTEFEFAKMYGCGKLLDLLHEKNEFPYSSIDRESLK